MKTILVFLCFALAWAASFSQVPETLPPNYIKTIEFKGDTQFSGTPIVKLGHRLTLEFDDLIGDEADYYYKISYYNFDWTPSQLAQNEYMEGFDNMRIKQFKNSFNTLQIYTHYKLTIPNQYTRGLKVSGNYMIGVYNEQRQLVFSRRFIVFEDLALVQAKVKRSRNLNYINTKQVINFSVSPRKNMILRNPDRNVKTLILKNNNLQTSIYDLKPQYHMGNKLIYRYDQKAAFMGGNEFLYFETKDVHGVGNNVRSIVMKNIYNAYLYTNSVRADNVYTYNPDINGHYLVTTIQGRDASIESEYMWVHFYLRCNKPLRGGELHFYGQFNNFAIDESTLMAHNPKTGLYEGKRLFKQGFYNYKYILLRKDGTIDGGFISGNHDKTENQYTVLVYYRDVGARYDRVIGVGSANSRDITN